jgi:anti-sigma factor RsiW
MSKESHIPDADLILAVDGEMSMLRKSQIHSHLVHCWTCHTRMKEIEDTIADFTRAYNDDVGARLPSASAPRALLRARLSQLAVEHPVPV